MLEILSDRYFLHRFLGSGGMSQVYAATTIKGQQEVAIKRMKKNDSDSRRRLEREISILSALDFPCFPKVIDVFEQEGVLWLVMEFIPGRTLAEHLRQKKRFSFEEVLQIASQLSAALLCLHNGDPPVIFRDLKPSNVMLTPENRVVLIDFGAARLSKGNLREDTELLGTRGFAAPEQYGGFGESDPRTDIYSLGKTLQCLLEGSWSEPGKPDNPMQTLKMILYKCTRQNPDQRFSSSHALFEAFRQIPQEKLPDNIEQEQTVLLNRPGKPFTIETRITFVQNPPSGKF